MELSTDQQRDLKASKLTWKGFAFFNLISHLAFFVFAIIFWFKPEHNIEGEILTLVGLFMINIFFLNLKLVAHNQYDKKKFIYALMMHPTNTKDLPNNIKEDNK